MISVVVRVAFFQPRRSLMMQLPTILVSVVDPIQIEMFRESFPNECVVRIKYTKAYDLFDIRFGYRWQVEAQA